MAFFIYCSGCLSGNQKPCISTALLLGKNMTLSPAKPPLSPTVADDWCITQGILVTIFFFFFGKIDNFSHFLFVFHHTHTKPLLKRNLHLKKKKKKKKEFAPEGRQTIQKVESFVVPALLGLGIRGAFNFSVCKALLNALHRGDKFMEKFLLKAPDTRGYFLFPETVCSLLQKSNCIFFIVKDLGPVVQS